MRNTSSQNNFLRTNPFRTSLAKISVLIALAAPALLGAKGGCGGDYVSLGTEAGEGGEAPIAGNGSGGSISGGAGRPDRGGSSSAGSPTFGGSPTSQGGASAASGESGAGAIGGGEGCYSPIQNPELALTGVAQGCPCDAGEACVTVQDQGRPHELALMCEAGRWQSVEDGPCFPASNTGASCKVGGRIYSDGSTYVPDAHSCNVCSCDDGQLTECTKIDCPSECPPNGRPGTQCAECGPADECLVLEHGCLPVCTDNDECNGAACVEGVCRRSLCG